MYSKYNNDNMKMLWLSAVALLGLTHTLYGEEQEQPTTTPPLTPRQLFENVCGICHGKNGEGSKALATPSVAGLPDWYIIEQIEKFRNDLRGTSPGDNPGQVMHNLVRTLGKKQTQSVAALIESMPMHPTQNLLGGDAEKGRRVFTGTCAKCHRFNGQGDKFFGSAPLIGLQDWYIRAQLEKFRKGIRGGSPEDEKGYKMHEMTQELAPEDAINVTAYIAELAKKHANQKPRRERELEEIRKRKAEEAAAEQDLPEELR